MNLVFIDFQIKRALSDSSVRTALSDIQKEVLKEQIVRRLNLSIKRETIKKFDKHLSFQINIELKGQQSEGLTDPNMKINVIVG